MTKSIKDPDAILDYSWDWSDWLVDGDTITAHDVTVPGGLAKGNESESGGVVTVFLSGGTVGEEYTVTCRVTTAAGRVDDRSRTIEIVQR